MKELQAAVERSPNMVRDEAHRFITRGLSAYKQGIIRNPWRIGGSGGGAPVSNDPRYPRKFQRQRSGALRDSHETKIRGLQGLIGPNTSVAPYAAFVHEGTSIMEPRPWLDYVKRTKAGEIRRLQGEFLQNIVRDLSK